MAWEPREGTKIAVLLAAMEAQRASRPIWSQTEAAQAMDVQRSMVPQYIAAACNADRLYRRTLANGGGIELSLERFPVHAPAPLPIPTFGKEAAAAAASTVVGWVPPQMTAPRPGSDHHLPKLAPGAPPAPSGIRVSLPPAPAPAPTGPEAAAADAAAVASAPPLAPAGITIVNVTDTQAAVREETAAGGDRVLVLEPADPAAQVQEEAEEPDAWYSVRTGAMVVTGVPQEEDGSFILPAELVADIRRQLAWGPLR